MAMIRVRKANTILSVTAEEKASYLAKGFDVLGESGKVIEESVPTDTATLQAKFLELKEENEKLRAEIKSLKQAKTKTVEPKIVETKVIEPTKEVIKEVPKRIRAKK